MDSIIDAIVKGLLEGGPDFLVAMGWLLFLVERYYIGPKRESTHRDDLKEMRNDVAHLSEKSTETLSRFVTLLEVIKDRLGNQPR